MFFSRSSALIGPVFQLSEEGKVATKVGTEGCKIGGSWGADWQNNLVLRPAHSGGVKTMSFTTPDSGCVGVVQVKKMPAGQPEEEPDPFQCYATSTNAGKDIGWFFTVHGGALCGNGMEDSNATGSCYNKVITVKADLDSGAITFYVDGKRCGPGFPTGVNGPLCFAVNAAKVGQRISIVPDPDLEAREAARAALEAQEQSNLDKELYDECSDQSKGDWDKVREMLNRGAAPDGYKVRRKQAAHSTACLVCSFSFFSRILWCSFLFFSVRFSFVCSLDDKFVLSVLCRVTIESGRSLPGVVSCGIPSSGRIPRCCSCPLR